MVENGTSGFVVIYEWLCQGEGLVKLLPLRFLAISSGPYIRVSTTVPFLGAGNITGPRAGTSGWNGVSKGQ